MRTDVEGRLITEEHNGEAISVGRRENMVLALLKDQKYTDFMYNYEAELTGLNIYVTVF